MTQSPKSPRPARTIVVSGGTGFVGQRLVAQLAARGDRIIVLSRGTSAEPLPQGAQLQRWSPDAPGPWQATLDGVDAIVHLAGESVIGKRWSDAQKKRIHDSRVRSTRLLVDAIAAAERKPAVFVSASAIGYYGAHPASEELTEESPPGEGFLANVVRDWESEASRAELYGVRTARMRIGIVLGKESGALQQMLLPFKLFGGGPIGGGEQVLSWIHLDDVIGLLRFVLDDARASGAFNVTAPAPVDMNTFATELGRALQRPSWLRVPSIAVRAALGEASEAVLTGQRVIPSRALALGYSFTFPTLALALRDLLG